MIEAKKQRLAARREAVGKALEIDGWLTPNEAAALFDLAYDAKAPIIEIGSWHGRSTVALALGSMAGGKQPVFAVDPFIPFAGGDEVRLTDQGNRAADKQASAETLRANLNRMGINGQVEIVPLTSIDAAARLPSCGVLFIDGDHSFEGCAADINMYLSKVVQGGMIMLHDVGAGDPGVERAVDEILLSRPSDVQLRHRVDSAVLVRKRAVERKQIVLMCPGRPQMWDSAVRGITQASIGVGHRIEPINNANGFDDFNDLWARALNEMEAGRADLAAMLHADVCPDPGWLDTLISEMEDGGFDMVSAAIPIKDDRGVLSCGVGDFREPGPAFRRWTVAELFDLPDTFTLADTEYAQDPFKFPLHNTGCWLINLRHPNLTAVDEHGDLRAWFDFPTKISRGPGGKWRNRRESEDWFFSRKIHCLGLRTAITRRAALYHEQPRWHNRAPWPYALWTCDEAGADKWKNAACPLPLPNSQAEASR